jgi:uncharacterized protein YbjT (DUF2867 family)
MKVILFGASGMVGQGVLRECVVDPDVEAVLAIVRKPTGQKHEKVTELQHEDFTDFAGVKERLTGYDACFFCLGVSSAGMDEAEYKRVTYDFTMAAARVLAEANPGMTFVYVSGEGTDGTEKGRRMWARVKGKTENDVMALPFKAAFAFRPGLIQPMHGIKSKTGLYRAAYAVATPLFPLIRAVAASHVTTSEAVGRAMIAVARKAPDKRVLENDDINELGAPR